MIKAESQTDGFLRWSFPREIEKISGGLKRGKKLTALARKIKGK